MIGSGRILRLGGSNNRQVFDGGKYISLEKQISNGILRVQCGAGKGFPQVYLIILNRKAIDMYQNWKDLIPSFIRLRLRQLHCSLIRRKGIAKYKKWADHPGVTEGENDPGELFSRYVKIVHLEIDRYCNRSCVYCANHKLPCRKEHSPMPEELYEKCLKELAEISYNAFIEFNGFNEPLADIPLLQKRIKMLKHYCPEARLLINSNGDFLNQDILDMLAESGVDHMMVTLHLNSNEFHLSEWERKQKFAAFEKRLSGCEFTFDPVMEIWQTRKENLLLIVRVSDFCLTGHNFAGCAGKKVRRDVPCYVPMLHYYVDYAGRVTFCCSANMDSPDCKPLIMGNAKENTVFEIYSSPQAKKFRKAMLTMKNMPSCCAVCDAQTGYCMNTAYQQNPYHPFFDKGSPDHS